MKHCYTIFRHEIRKLLSDKKTLMSMFLLPFITVLMLVFISYSTSEDVKTSYRVFILDNAVESTTIEYEGDVAIEIIPLDHSTYEEAISNCKIEKDDVVMKFDNGNAVVYFDSTSNISETLSNFCMQYVDTTYNVSFTGVNNLSVMEVQISDYSKSGSNALIAMFLPYMLILLLFTNVTNYTCDTIAGEKERGTFAKTILSPISTSSMILGKSLSSTMCGLFSSFVYVVIIGCGSVALNQVLGMDIFGFEGIELTISETALLILYAILLCVLLSNLAVLCSLYAKTAKEARSLLIPFMGVSILLSLLSIMRVGTLPAYSYLIPIYNICITIQDIFLKNVDVFNMVVAAVSLLALSLAIFLITLFSFKKENIRY